jgi:hypothetical protein
VSASGPALRLMMIVMIMMTDGDGGADDDDDYPALYNLETKSIVK